MSESKLMKKMRAIAGIIGRQLSCAIPLGVWRRIVPRDVIALCYHVVSDQSLPHVRHLFAYKSVDAFRQDLLFLQRNYRVISYRELHEHQLAGKRLEPRSVHISFDDGLAECETVVRPLLVDLGLPCTFFINTDFIDNRSFFYRNQASLCIDRLQDLSGDESGRVLRKVAAHFGRELHKPSDLVQWIGMLNHADSGTLNELSTLLGVDCKSYLTTHQPYLTRDQIGRLVADGFTLGGHTRSHERLMRTIDSAEIQRQIVQSCQDIRDLTGQTIVPFAFPFSGVGVDRAILSRILREHQFIGLLFDTQKLKKDSDFVVNRICCDHPPGDLTPSSNLPTALRNAYFSLTTSFLGT